MLFWQRTDLVKRLLPNVDFDEVQRLRVEAQKLLQLPNYADLPEFFEPLPTADELCEPLFVDLTGDHVTIGRGEDVSEKQFSLLEQAIGRLQPWRKGPFKLFGFEIDAEWRSNLKWDRIEPALGQINGLRVLDVGCGNGYYMFRAAAHDPRLVLGLDPSVPFLYAFELMQRFLRDEKLQYELLGVDQLYVFKKAFDVALCMGVLYHHRSPIEILRNLLDALQVGGWAIIECQTIPDDGSVALFPEERYAKARNVFFVPTRDCLINWVKRAGFKNVELVSHTKVTADEQRSTDLMTFESISDFLDPDDDNLTIEGYPAPYRTVLRAERLFL